MENTLKLRVVFLFMLFVFMIYFINAEIYCSPQLGGEVFCSSQKPENWVPTQETYDPPPCGDGEETLVGCIPVPKEDEPALKEEPKKQKASSKSQAEINCKKVGCWESNYCYAFGFVKEGKYCKEDGMHPVPAVFYNGFVNQSETGVQCVNNFECLTNICSQGACVNFTEQVNRQVDIKVDEIKTEIVNKVEESISKLNDSEEYFVNVDDAEVSINKNIMEKFLNWLKEILGV